MAVSLTSTSITWSSSATRRAGSQVSSTIARTQRARSGKAKRSRGGSAGVALLLLELHHAHGGVDFLWIDDAVDPGPVVQDEPRRDDGALDDGAGADVHDAGGDEL